MIWTLAIVGIFVTALFVVDQLIAAPKYSDDNSNHFDGTKFINPNDNDTHHYGEVLKWWFSGNDKGPWEKLTLEDISQSKPVSGNLHHNECHITFVNHCTFLIQTNGLNILTDPIWSDRASPYSWIGPKRMRPPGIAFEDLPHIDAVLLSHNHYDHLDIKTVKRLRATFNPQFVVPLGVEKYLHNQGIKNTAHLDWWDEFNLHNQLSLTAVPGQHFSGRGLFDRNRTLWCGYVLHASAGNIYFAADTGYGNFIHEIRNRFGPIFTSLLPIGAYKPRWFMEPIHMSPEEAVQAHLDLESQQSIASHFGTFPMADDGMHEPVEELEKSRQKLGIANDRFFTLDEGQTYIPNNMQKAVGSKA